MDTRSASTPSRRSRVMVIGLDGATWQLARPWAEAGHLPTFRRLMQEGAWGALESVMPPITPAAWSSFATGMNAGGHGVFDFVGRQEGSYDTYVANAGCRDGVPLWQLACQAGRQVTVFNVPASYPPERVDGLMVSGFLTPAHATDGSWPAGLQAELARAVPKFTVYPPTVFSPGMEAEFAQAVADLNQATLEAVHYLLHRQSWDLLIAVFMGTDVIQHFMWGAMVRREGEMADAILRCYQQMDAGLAELMQNLTPDDYLVVMSDHGFGPLTHYLHVNAWLAERGYLRFRRNPVSAARYAAYRLGLTPLGVYEKLRVLGLGRRMQDTASTRNEQMKAAVRRLFLSFADVDWSRTRAYSLGFGGPIFVNLLGREPQGIVRPGTEYDRLLEQIGTELQQTPDPTTGQPIVDRIYRRHELYTGAHADRAPDLIFVPADWRYQPFGTHELASHRWLEPCHDRSGTHRRDGLLLLSGPGIRSGLEIQGAALVDIAPTVLALLGIPVPANLDGRLLSTALDDEALAGLRVSYVHEEERGQARDPMPGMSPEDEELMRQHLRALGYVA